MPPVCLTHQPQKIGFLSNSLEICWEFTPVRHVFIMSPAQCRDFATSLFVTDAAAAEWSWTDSFKPDTRNSVQTLTHWHNFFVSSFCQTANKTHQSKHWSKLSWIIYETSCTVSVYCVSEFEYEVICFISFIRGADERQGKMRAESKPRQRSRSSTRSYNLEIWNKHLQCVSTKK